MLVPLIRQLPRITPPLPTAVISFVLLMIVLILALVTYRVRCIPLRRTLNKYPSHLDKFVCSLDVYRSPLSTLDPPEQITKTHDNYLTGVRNLGQPLDMKASFNLICASFMAFFPNNVSSLIEDKAPSGVVAVEQGVTPSHVTPSQVTPIHAPFVDVIEVTQLIDKNMVTTRLITYRAVL